MIVAKNAGDVRNADCHISMPDVPKKHWRLINNRTKHFGSIYKNVWPNLDC